MSKKKCKEIEHFCSIPYTGKHFIFSKEKGFRISIYNKATTAFYNVPEFEITDELRQLLQKFDNLFFAEKDIDYRTFKKIEKRIMEIISA